MPLKESGGSLTVGFGSGGSPPLVIPRSHTEGSGFLKISLFSRSPDPLSDIQSFRSAPYLRDNLKGPWATITKEVIHRPSEPPSPLIQVQPLCEEFQIPKPTTHVVVSSMPTAIPSNQYLIDHLFQKPSRPRSLVLSSKGVERKFPPPRPVRSISIHDSVGRDDKRSESARRQKASMPDAQAKPTLPSPAGITLDWISSAATFSYHIGASSHSPISPIFKDILYVH